MYKLFRSNHVEILLHTFEFLDITLIFLWIYFIFLLSSSVCEGQILLV